MRIGITAGIGKKQFFINHPYVQFVKDAGHEPILITPENNAAVIAEMCDGLLIPGGIDIDPTHYGFENLASFSVDPVKDNFEREILHAFIELAKPVFGICRGFQLIVQEFLNLPENLGNHQLYYMQHIDHHSLTGDRQGLRTSKAHSVFTLPRLFDADNQGIETQRVFVNSMHHQALRVNSDALQNSDNWSVNNCQILAMSTFGIGNGKNANRDEIVEAVEVVINGARLRGVQWHPEELTRVDKHDLQLLTAFFNEDAIEVIGAPMPAPAHPAGVALPAGHEEVELVDLDDADDMIEPDEIDLDVSLFEEEDDLLEGLEEAIANEDSDKADEE